MNTLFCVPLTAWPKCRVIWMECARSIWNGFVGVGGLTCDRFIEQTDTNQWEREWKPVKKNWFAHLHTNVNAKKNQFRFSVHSTSAAIVVAVASERQWRGEKKNSWKCKLVINHRKELNRFIFLFFSHWSEANNVFRFVEWEQPHMLFTFYWICAEAQFLFAHGNKGWWRKWNSQIVERTFFCDKMSAT